MPEMGISGTYFEELLLGVLGVKVITLSGVEMRVFFFARKSDLSAPWRRGLPPRYIALMLTSNAYRERLHHARGLTHTATDIRVGPKRLSTERRSAVACRLHREPMRMRRVALFRSRKKYKITFFRNVNIFALYTFPF